MVYTYKVKRGKIKNSLRVEYATLLPATWGKRFVVAYRLQNVAKLRQIYLIYKKNGGKLYILY